MYTSVPFMSECILNFWEGTGKREHTRRKRSRKIIFKVYRRLYSLSVFSLAKDSRVNLGNQRNLRDRFASFLQTDNWLICRLQAHDFWGQCQTGCVFLVTVTLYKKTIIGYHKNFIQYLFRYILPFLEPEYVNPEIDISVIPVEACVTEGLTPQTPGFKLRSSRCFLGQVTFLHFFSLHWPWLQRSVLKIPNMK